MASTRKKACLRPLTRQYVIPRKRLNRLLDASRVSSDRLLANNLWGLDMVKGLNPDVPEAELMRSVEVPELHAVRQRFVGLWIDDVTIRPVLASSGQSLGWMAVVILYRPNRRGPEVPLTWTLGLRATEDDARAAVTALLKGLLKGQKRALSEYPSSGVTHSHQYFVEEAVTGAVVEWQRRRWPAPPRTHGGGGHPGARPARQGPASVPEHMKAWGQTVKATRMKWGWTQRELAEKIGIDPPRLSKLERGIWLAPDDVVASVCDVLDMNAPEPIDG